MRVLMGTRWRRGRAAPAPESTGARAAAGAAAARLSLDELSLSSDPDGLSDPELSSELSSELCSSSSSESDAVSKLSPDSSEEPSSAEPGLRAARHCSGQVAAKHGIHQCPYQQ